MVDLVTFESILKRIKDLEEAMPDYAQRWTNVIDIDDTDEDNPASTPRLDVVAAGPPETIELQVINDNSMNALVSPTKKADVSIEGRDLSNRPE